MRIVYVHSQGLPPAGGDGVHVWSIATRLAERGHDVLLRGGAVPPGAERIAPGRVAMLRAVRSADAVLVRIDGRFGSERAGAAALSARPQPAVVWEVNSSLEEEALHGVPAATVQRHRRLRRLLARQAAAAVVVSDELLPYATDQLGIADSTVVENGAAWPWPEVQASALRHAGRFRALWMGSGHNPWQALDVVAAAARLLEQGDGGVVVAVAGSGVADAVPRPWPGNLLHLGPASREEVAAHLAAAGCALVLYHDTPWAPGGFTMSPIKLFEAWAAGVPVVATALGSLRRLVRDGETGLLVDDDPAAVAAAVTRLQDDAALRARLAEAGRAAVRDRYNWQRAGDQVADVLERVVGARRR